MKILKLALPIAMSALVGTAVGVGTTTVLVEHAEAAAESRVAALAPASGPHVAAWVEAPVLLAAGAEAPVEPDAGVDAASPEPADAVLTSPSAAEPWGPLGWDWGAIGLWAFTILGALIAALRPISKLTRWTFDDKVVARLEWLMALLLKIFTPPGARLASLGGGKSADGLTGASGGKGGVA